ncbi:hypothetical protein Y032_0024g898 [Ancylostoma ceylanicum]|uniref:BTB domain-containing protein n=1 Tax=Ancylostoma ceylanicum TaxID=53326 RepID=A0A016UWZ6_9BILA|nr:hypothetical protein Y032_0024g898 [Ancylostoma ceylanicum]
MFGAGGGAEEFTPKAISNGSVILEQPTGSDVQEISKSQEKNEVLEKDQLNEDSETLVDITVSGLDYFPYPSLRHIGDDVDDICVNHEHILYGQAFSTLDELRRDGLLCDVELSVGDHRTIAAHRVVLAAVIPYFHAMFTVDMVESTKKKITIRNIDFATLELIVSYAYCGRLHINVENVLPVMYAANFLQLNALTEKCANYLKHHMHLSNVLGVRAVCSSLNCSSEETERFVEKYFTSICLTKSFLELSIDELTMLLAKNSLNVENEETVCKAALRWIDHDPTHRKVYISRILKCLRLLALNPSFLVVDLGRHPLVREDKQSRDILDEVKDYLLVPNLERSSQPPFSAEPRHCGDLPCLIYAIGGASSDAEGTVLSKSEVYDPARRKWSQAEPLLTIRKEFGTAVLDGKIYVFGGHAEPENILNTVDTYDYVPNVWVSVTPMPTARFSVSVAAINNKLYVCGGENGAMLGIVEVFCPENNCWEAGAPMLTPRSRAAISVLGGCLYCEFNCYY